MPEDFRSEMADLWERRALVHLRFAWALYATAIGIAFFSTRYDTWSPLSFLFIALFLSFGIVCHTWRLDSLKRAAAARERHKRRLS